MIATPLHLLTLVATRQVATVSQEDAGAPQTTYAAASVTHACNLQPAASREALTYQRETGVTTYDLFLSPLDSAGNKAAFVKNDKVSVVLPSGTAVTLLIIGEAMDLCTNDTVLRMTCERET